MSGRRNHVLIVGAIDDPHVIQVASQVRRLGCAAFVLDMYNGAHRIDVRITASGSNCSFQTNEGNLRCDQIRSIWWRLKPKLPAEYRGAHSNESEAFRLREWRTTLRALPKLMPEIRWINDPEIQERFSQKLRQLSLARDVGLRIPDTIVTNSHIAAAGIFSKHSRAIYKVVSWYFHVPELLSDTSLAQTVYTTEVAEQQLLDEETSISHAPGQFQQLVAKDHELRVNVVGDRVFVARINSQSREDTSLDWRKNQPAGIYAQGELSSKTLKRLLQFHREARLTIAAYDFIVTPEREELFLECNPAGQWLWLEERLGLEVSAALASELVEQGGASVS